MPRKSNVRYWKSRKGGGYFTTVKGRQVELALGPDDEKENGPTYRAAVRKWIDLEMGTAGPDQMTFRGLYSKYAAAEHPGRVAEHRQKQLTLIAPLVEALGDVCVSALTAGMVEDFLARQTAWVGTTKATAVGRFMAILNWGVRRGDCRTNPLKGKLDVPAARRRGPEARMSAALMDLLEASAARPALRLLLRVLRATGARPIEIREATHDRYHDGVICHPWQPPAGTYRWKNAKKVKKDRVIYLPADLAGELDALCRSGDRGPLLLSPNGCKWTMSIQKQQWWRLLRRKAVAFYLAGHRIDPRHVVPYCYRHTWISDWLDAGRPLLTCAELTGTSVSLIEKVYGHPDRLKIRQQFLDFAASR
jgi:integrase